MSELTFNAYAIVSRAIHEGVALGLMRAHKHTDNPEVDDVQNSVEQEVMNALCEVLVFPTGSDE